MNDNKKMALYAQFVCGIESLQQHGIQVSRKITSRKGELFITHLYLSSQHMYFQNLQKYWDEMVNACNKDLWPDWKLEELDKEFKADITGNDDILFSENNDEK